MTRVVSDDTVRLNPTTRGEVGLRVRDFGCVLAAVLVGLALRLTGTTDNSMSHWDEAFYALSAALPLHRELPIHAPPGYPFLVHLAQPMVGSEGYSAGVFVSALFGTATIPLLFLLARRVGGTGLACVAAWGLALSDLHVAYSRSWLTDATLGFWFVLAIYCVLRVFEARSLFWPAASALATGAAWNVKYNGWMPIPIGISAIVAEALRAWANRGGRRHRAAEPGVEGRPVAESRLELPSRASVVLRLILAGLAAVLLFVPWYRYVEMNYDGGYATVRQYHALFIGGLSAWWDNASHLARVLPAFRHVGWLITLTVTGVLLCLLVARCFTGNAKGRGEGDPPQRQRWNRRVVVIVMLLAVIAVAGGGTDLFWIAAACPSCLVCLAWGRRRDLLLAAWFGSFFVLVPSYHPYVRLLVPAVPAAILVTLRAAVLSGAFAISAGRSETSPTRRASPWAVLATAVVLGLACGRWRVDEIRGTWSRWSSEQSYRAFARFVEAETPKGSLIVCITQPTVWSPLSSDYRVPENSPLLLGAATSPPSYLAVDFTMYLHPNDLASDVARIVPCLTYVGGVANDMSLPGLVNLLGPQEFWAKMAPSRLPPRADGLPSALSNPAADRIALFRLDGCTSSDQDFLAAYRRVLRSGTVFYAESEP